MTAWISSTITVRTVRSRLRLRSAVSSRYSDSGVVTRMCGGVRRIAARSDCGGVAGPHGRGDARRLDAHRLGELADAAPRLRQVLVDVGAQRLERRDVDDPDLVRKRRRHPLAHQVVDGSQEGRERLAGPGRGGNQCVPAIANRRPAATLRGRRLSERLGKPASDERDGNQKVPWRKARAQESGIRAQGRRPEALAWALRPTRFRLIDHSAQGHGPPLRRDIPEPRSDQAAIAR